MTDPVHLAPTAAQEPGAAGRKGPGMSEGHRNWVPATAGKARMVCRFCGRLSAPQSLAWDGQPDLRSAGWSEAPYPADCTHDDGSVGSMYSCRNCNALLRAGYALARRGDGRPQAAGARPTAVTQPESAAA